MTPQEHAALLLELANEVEDDLTALRSAGFGDEAKLLESLLTRARAAAAELGELPDVETLAEFIYADAMLPAAKASPETACEPPEWKGGNSLMEDVARRCARAVLTGFGGGDVAEAGERRGEYRFAVTVNGDWMAGGSAPTKEQAEREAKHYLSQYEFDGNCIAVIEHCVEVVRFAGGEVKPKQ